jgi:8-oxoguanine deaminase
MPTRLVKNIHTLVTMDRDRRELHKAAIFVSGNGIARSRPCSLALYND